MSVSVLEQKLIDNEVMSSKPNKKISRDIDHLIQIAEEDNQTDLLPELDTKILFFCECADEKCRERTRIKKSTYDEFHKSNRTFTLKPGHNIPAIERVIYATDTYIVVEKYHKPNKNVSKFHETDLQHAQPGG